MDEATGLYGLERREVQLERIARQLLGALGDILTRYHVPDNGLEGEELEAYQAAEVVLLMARSVLSREVA